MHLPAFGEINRTYEKKVPSARASIDDAQQNVFSGTGFKIPARNSTACG
jgi:hypothetical protein